MCHITQSPLKMLHWLAGPQNATYFIIDHPEETKELARIHEEKALALLEQVVDLPETEIFFSGDNLDSMFYPPRFYRDYCDSFFTRAAEIIHRRGKRFVVHACGRNHKLLPLVGASGVDCLEGHHAGAAGRRPARRRAAAGGQARLHRQRRHGLAAPGTAGRRGGGAAQLHGRAVCEHGRQAALHLRVELHDLAADAVGEPGLPCATRPASTGGWTERCRRSPSTSAAGTRRRCR